MKNLIVTVIVLLGLPLLTGCAALKDKGVAVLTDSKVGKVTMTDPSGSGNPMPQVVIGAMAGTWVDCPPGCKLESVQISYKLFSDTPSTIQFVKMDATQSGKITQPVLDTLKKDGYISEELYNKLIGELK